MTRCDLKLNVAERVAGTEAEGPGIRYALWVQGCPLRCPGCCNPDMLDHRQATWLNIEVLAEEIRSTPHIEGVTFLGGEPFAQADSLGLLAQKIQGFGLSVMVFSGFTYEQLKQSTASGYQTLLNHTDLLVDGPYIRSKHVNDRRWIGSSNQRIWFLSHRYAYLRDSESGWDTGSNSVEIRLRGNQIFINGFPHPDLKSLIAQLGSNHVNNTDEDQSD